MSDQLANFTESVRLLHTPQGEFSSLVKHAVASKDTEAPRVDLLFLRYKESTPDEDGLAEAVAYQVVNYALPKKKVKELLAEAKPGVLDFSHHAKLLAEAKRAFIEYNPTSQDPKANIRYAEIGEVIAFCVASHYLSAGQVAAKMALKTNSEMPVYGLDGIHVRPEPDGTITVFFLEAKMVGDAKSGGGQYASSAAGFSKDRDHKLNEQRIARDLSNLDILEASAKDAALNYFNPYGSQTEKVRERFVGVVVYNEPGYQDKLPVTDATPLDAHEKSFLSKYTLQHGELVTKMETALKNLGVENGKCRTFFLAVPDTNRLKALFAKAMTR